MNLCTGMTTAADVVANMRAVMATLPKRHTFLSWSLFPNDSATVVHGAGEDFTVAGPALWKLAIAACGSSDSPHYLAAIELIDVDPRDTDDDATKRWKKAWRDRFNKAMQEAMRDAG